MAHCRSPAYSFMLQSLRLAYLRRVDDPAGPRIITFKAPETRDQTEQEDDERSNGHYKASSSLSAMSGLAGFSPPTGWKRKRRRGQAQSRATVDTGSHVDLSGLNNPELWPELEIAHSPEISTPIADFASRRVGGPGGKGLGYSTTIYGPGRTGALGMRVSGKRASVDASNSLRNKFGARSTIDVIDEDSTLREQPAPVGRGSLEVSSASSTPVASRRISAEAKSTGQSDWRAARTERLRNLAEAADAHRQPKPSSLGDSTPSGLSSLAESQSTIGPEGQITAQLAKEGSNPPGVENSESPSSRPIRPPRRTQRPGSSSSISSLQSSGAGSLMPLAASQSSESLTQPAVSAVTSRSRSASEGATTSPVPSLARNGKGFDSLEALDKMSANSGETQEMLSGSMGYNTGYTSAGASSSENEGSDVHLGRRSMQIRMAPADPENEKTPINQRHFFTPITEQDEPFFTSSMVNQHSPAEDEESPALEHAKLDGEKEMVKSPEIHVHEVGPDEETMLTSGHPASEIGSPGSLADQDFLGDAQRSHILALSPGSQESDSLPQGRDLSKQLETEPLSVDQPPIGTNATVEDSTKADEVDRGQAEKAQTSRKAVENDWFVSLRKEIRPPASGSRPSALTAKLRKQDAAPENPFAAFYAGVAARNTGEPSVKIDLYFPFAKLSGPAPLPPTPRAIISADRKRRMMKATVRKDATMEELIGFGMFCFIEEGWEPRFWENLSPPEMEVKLTTVGWALRIVEDGEVDDDFPAIDRTLTVGRFGSDEFAIVEASQTQGESLYFSFLLVCTMLTTSGVRSQAKPVCLPKYQASNLANGGSDEDFESHGSLKLDFCQSHASGYRTRISHSGREHTPAGFFRAWQESQRANEQWHILACSHDAQR